MKKRDFFAGAAIGAVIGSVIGIFFAPKSGKDTLKDIKKNAMDVSKKITSELSKLKEVGKKEYEDIIEKAMKELKKSKNFTDDKIKEIEKELKSKWGSISKEFQKKGKATIPCKKKG